MNHSQPVFSPEGTPLEERTVSELVAEHPNLSRVFQSFDMGFCCQGKITLGEACKKKGVLVSELILAIENELAGPQPTEENLADWPLDRLVEYIVVRHHTYLHNELPRIHAMAERVAQVHGGHTPSLIEVFYEFSKIATDLSYHTKKEEMILFPAIAKLEPGQAHMVQVTTPIQSMQEEHENTSKGLTRLRELTNNYSPPPEACNTYRALFAGLAELEQELAWRIQMENEILFPAARKLCG